MLTVRDLIRKGYLHDHVIPPLRTEGLAGYLDQLPTDPKDQFWRQPSFFSRCVKHSAPKRRYARRTLGIPNPQHQIPLCLKLVEHWRQIELHCGRSHISLSTPEVKENSIRAVDRASYFRDLSSERILRSGGTRFHLYADFARYYSSIYTHSIGWALHGKEIARADREVLLAGNQLDDLVRATQDRQSIGIPVGPDTSLIIAEIIATSIDRELEQAGIRQGIRYVDDFHLYFRSRGECERGIAELHSACSKFGLDVNDAKTFIEELPDILEQGWKSNLKGLAAEAGVGMSTSELLSYFNAAFQLSKDYPSDGVLKYTVATSGAFVAEDFKLFQSFLCRCMLVEPSCLPDAFRIFKKEKLQVWGHPTDLNATIEELLKYHAPLQHGYEVAWALWFAVEFELPVSAEVAKAVSRVEDDSVALAALHARECGLIQVDPSIVWQSWLCREQLSGEHWLAAYEMSVKKWVPSSDFIKDHAFFSRLRSGDVSFYDRNVNSEPEATF